GEARPTHRKESARPRADPKGSIRGLDLYAVVTKKTLYQSATRPPWSKNPKKSSPNDLEQRKTKSRWGKASFDPAAQPANHAVLQQRNRLISSSRLLTDEHLSATL